MPDDFVLKVRVMVFAPEGDPKCAFGKGTAQLLKGVEAYASLNRAAKELNMAYSKAWKSIKGTEAYFGHQLIERHAQHGSVLTEYGKHFLALYEEAERRALEAVKDVFKDF
jgi:molybdate transport system regulatory protein